MHIDPVDRDAPSTEAAVVESEKVATSPSPTATVEPATAWMFRSSESSDLVINYNNGFYLMYDWYYTLSTVSSLDAIIWVSISSVPKSIHGRFMILKTQGKLLGSHQILIKTYP